MAEKPLRIFLSTFFYSSRSDCCIRFHVHRAQSFTVYSNFRLVTLSGFRVNQRRFFCDIMCLSQGLGSAKLMALSSTRSSDRHICTKNASCAILLEENDPWMIRATSVLIFTRICEIRVTRNP